MILARVERNPAGPRLFVGPLRIHHWHWGAALVLAGTQAGPWGLPLIAAGAYLIAVDRHDLPGAGRSIPRGEEHGWLLH